MSFGAGILAHPVAGEEKKVDKGGHCFVTHDPIYGRDKKRGKRGVGRREKG